MESVLSDFMAFPSLTPFQASLYLFFFPPAPTPFFPPPLSLPNSLFKTKLNLSLKEKKISSPFKARKSSCHTGKKHVDLTGRLSDKPSSDRKTVAGGSRLDIKCPKSEQPLGGKKHDDDTVQSTKTIIYLLSH